MKILSKKFLYSLLVVFICCFSVTSIRAQSKHGFDSTKAIKEIEERNEVYISALKTGDSIALGNFYTADAKIFNSGMPTTDGRSAIVHFYGRNFRNGIRGCKIVTTGVWGSDHNLIVEEGTISFLLGNGATAVKGRYVLVWKREDGLLKIFKDSFASDN